MSIEITRSRALRQRALAVIPGGVNSPVRAFRAVGGEPLFIARAKGAQIWDADGNPYLDYVGSWGPLILGHAPEPVVSAIQEAATQGTSFGATTEREVLFAETLTQLVPSLDKVRLVNSGTEATMSALRLARGFTGRDKVVKVAGGYHGHADSFLVQAGSGATTLGRPDSAGVPAGAAADTLTLPYNDLDAARALFAERGGELAAFIVEPVAGNMGVIPPEPGYLEGVRQLTSQAGALLIFDEVISGFRLGLGGAQARYGVTPDLTCLGKIIGGGLPVGAYGGKAQFMDQIAPEGPIYQAGTLSGNPLAVAAGQATLQALIADPPYERLEQLGATLEAGLATAAAGAGVPLQINRAGSMLTAFFSAAPVRDYASAKASDTERFARYHRKMLERGIYLAPSQFEASFLCTAHTALDIERTLTAASETLRGI